MDPLTVVALMRKSLRFSHEASHPSAGWRSVPIRFGLVAFAITISALLALVVAAPAQAAKTRLPTAFSPITGAGSGLSLHEPSAIAIDEATGNAFLSDANGGEPAAAAGLAVFGGEGGVPAGLTAPYKLPGIAYVGGSGAGLAYDNSSTSPNQGTLYAYDQVAETIKKYVRNPATEQYEQSGEFPAPGLGFSPGLGIDEDGNVYMAGKEPVLGGQAKLFKFNPAGVTLANYTIPGEVNLAQVAIDAVGDVFIQGSEGLYVFRADPFGEIDPTVFTKLNIQTRGVAYNRTTNRISVVSRKDPSSPWTVTEYNAETLAIFAQFGRGVLSSAAAQVAVDAETDRVYVVDRGNKNVAVFGAPVTVPTTTIAPASGVTGLKATLNGAVNPEGLSVTECFFEYGETATYGQTVPCEQSIPTDSASHNVSANISGLVPDGNEYHYRLVAANENGTERSPDQTLVTAATVVTEPPSAVDTTIATLHGTVFPEGSQYTECVFEYGLTTKPGFEAKTDCNPPFGSIPPDFSPHAVSAAISGLQPNGIYRFRLTATNGHGTVSGATLTFSVTGPPQITEVRALNATQSSATIEAKIDPRRFQTNYFFEWGPTSAYGNRIPANLTEPSVGGGEGPVPVTATLSGLAPTAIYHYRVIAKSNAGTTVSSDHELETINSCAPIGKLGLGLPEGRCFELVSPRDPGPIAIPARVSPEEMDWQASPQPGSLAYVIASGLPPATRGGQVTYQATRGPGTSGWSSSQLSPPVLARNETKSVNSNPSKIRGLSEDLSCGVVESSQPLSFDPSMRAITDAGGVNLFRRNPNGSYSGISNLPPENPNEPETVTGSFGFIYSVAGFSSNCGKIFITAPYRYPGVPAASPTSTTNFYEWNEGVLQSVGYVPGPEPGEETLVQAAPGAFPSAALGLGSSANAVSTDGSRVFFSAKRLTSPNPSEVGQTGVFVRDNGKVTRDLSLSETATPDFGAIYQYATKDGTRVFFTANTGLTADRNAEGTDLYEYNLVSNQLTDLSVAFDPAGVAGVAGFIGASRDGSHVYFVARGQLVPGKGKTSAENTATNSYSVYAAVGGNLSYVGAVTQLDMLSFGTIVGGGQNGNSERLTQSSRVSPDGRYLLFQSSANVTGYVSGGVPEAYLYDHEASTEATKCISCRQDGKPSVTPPSNGPLGDKGILSLNPLYDPTRLAIRNGKPIVFFSSFDHLAVGAEEGNANLYEWAHDQVFHIASAPPGLAEPENSEGQVQQFVAFIDASAEATDLYFGTPASLNWEDGDGRNSVYTARIGGGFVQPPGPPFPCDPTVEGACQGNGAAPPQAPNAGSNTFNGPGNPKPKKHKKKHKKKNSKHKKKNSKGKKGKGKKQGQKSKKQASKTNEHRRAGK